jgi:hypothetical protein
VFNPSKYVKEDKKTKYESNSEYNFSQAQRENYLIGMMKVNYLKRLESSINSFAISLDRTIQKIDSLMNKIDNFASLNQTEEEIDAEEIVDEENEDTENQQVGEKLKFDLADLELDVWKKDLQNDRDALITLYNSAQVITPERDAKLRDLKQLIAQKIKNPFNKGNSKVIVFTAFADTAQYLYNNIQPWTTQELGLHSALVYGSGSKTTYGHNDYDHILLNFSPRAKRRAEIEGADKNGEIDILIATDCISEGQNLQDCDYLVNYDIHWNPVRIIQRFGRIDRIGARNESIQLVNFWPTADLDNYINLKERVEVRMALVDLTATADDNILNTAQFDELVTDELQYRKKQLQKLQREVLDLEDMEETISLTDFTLDDFRIELFNFIERNKQRLEDAPLGLYACVPSPAGEYERLYAGRELSDTEKDIIRPGVIFCLENKKAIPGENSVNPLEPYFLVYIRNDGTVRYNYTQAKSILEIFRTLCQNQKKAFDDLCVLFNEETDNCKKMDRYTGLARKAAEEITQVYRRKENMKLSSDRSAVIKPAVAQLGSLGDFNLVTWLIIW